MAYNYARTLYATPPEPAPARLSWINEAYDHFKWNWQVWVSALVIAGAIGAVVLTIWFLIVGLSWLESLISGAMSLSPTGATPTAWLTKYMLTPTYFVLAYGGMAIGYILLALFNGGYFVIANNCLRGKQSTLADFFGGMKYLPGMLLVTLIIAAPGIVGSVAEMLRAMSSLSSPGALTSAYPTSFAASMTRMFTGWGVSLLISLAYVIMAVLFAPAMALIADGVGVRESIGRSVRLMSGTFWPAFGLGALFGLIYYATGCATCMLATTVTIPMLYLMGSIAARERLGLVVTGYVPPAPAPPPGADMSGIWPPPPNPSGQPPAGWGAVYSDPNVQRPPSPPLGSAQDADPGAPPQDAPPPEPPRF